MKRGLWLLLWLCFWPGFLKAETLTLSKIYELALSRHPLIRAAEAEVEAARAGVREAKGAFLPQIDLRELYARTDSPPQVFSYKLAQKNFKPEDFLRANFRCSSICRRGPLLKLRPGWPRRWPVR
ncbi:MAG TPA: hypothetical protein EYP81_04250 [Thermodesulfobacteriaceae bacterium]|nr:hypothetical protein [Thermodesulfobacteriaceae bacterium]